MERKGECEAKQDTDEEIVWPVQKQFISKHTLADIEFDKHFCENSFGFACCDWLWFENDLCNAPQKSNELLKEIFLNKNISQFKVCKMCYKALGENKVSCLSCSNGFD